MKHKLILPLLALLATLISIELTLDAGGFLLSRIEEMRNRHSSQKGTTVYTILTLGESTTFLGGEKSWPRQLERILNDKKIGTTFSVINKALPSTNSTAILSQLEKNLDTYRPNLVISMMGINDTDVLQEGFTPTDVLPTDSPFIHFIKNLHLYKFIRTLKSIVFASDPSYEEQARLLGDSGKQDEAVLLLLGALDKIGKNDSIYVALGQAYRLQGKQNEPEQAYRQALSINPKNAEALGELGKIYYDLGQYEQAEQYLNKSLEANPMIYDPLLKLGALRIQFGRYDEAEKFFTRAVALPQNSYLAFMQLAHIYRLQGREKEAKQTEERALRRFTLVTNYRELRDTIQARGIKLIAMQYPLRSAISLIALLDHDPKITFVSNEITFQQALQSATSDDLFTDHFAGDFGHATAKGNLLIAQNAADAILREVFRK